MNLQPITHLLAPITALLALVLLLTRSSETPKVLGRWPLAEPQANIVTRGVDDSYSDLDRWLIERDFRPARCFAVPGLGDGVVILYLEPELMSEEVAIDCAPEDLAWPERAA